MVDPTNSTDTQLRASAVLQPRLFAEPRERSGRWRIAALEVDQTALVEINLRRGGISGKTGATTRQPETDESVSAGRCLSERVTTRASREPRRKSINRRKARSPVGANRCERITELERPLIVHRAPSPRMHYAATPRDRADVWCWRWATQGVSPIPFLVVVVNT